mmetsp:Transcript_7080/g.18117  ORF Transcript_7080/g.18117 Transcript_7080/m.18117 type:complete len:195 (+) Transcript_7080:75-659(+)
MFSNAPGTSTSHDAAATSVAGIQEAIRDIEAHLSRVENLLNHHPFSLVPDAIMMSELAVDYSESDYNVDLDADYDDLDLHSGDLWLQQMPMTMPWVFDPRLNRHVNRMDASYLHPMDDVVLPQPARFLHDAVRSLRYEPPEARSAEPQWKNTSGTSQVSRPTKRQNLCRRVLGSLGSQGRRLLRTCTGSRVRGM